MKNFNWGIVGLGNIAVKMADALKLCDNANLYAVASRSSDKAEAFRAEHGADKAYGHYDALYNDPNIDIVYIATTHNAHYSCAMDAIAAGKHVLIEKPMAVNECEVSGIIETAKKHGVFAMEALWTRFLPVYNDVHDWVNNGLIGEIRSVTADFMIGPFEETNGWRLFDPETAGGALLDLGIYPINFAAAFLGAVPCDTGGTAILSELGADINDAVYLRYENAVASFRTGLVSTAPNTGKINGSKGYIELDSCVFSKKACLYSIDHKLLQTSEYEYKNGFEFEARHTMERITNGYTESDVMPLSETLKIVRIMDILRKKWGVVYPFEKI